MPVGFIVHLFFLEGHWQGPLHAGFPSNLHLHQIHFTKDSNEPESVSVLDVSS